MENLGCFLGQLIPVYCFALKIVLRIVQHKYIGDIIKGIKGHVFCCLFPPSRGKWVIKFHFGLFKQLISRLGALPSSYT